MLQLILNTLHVQCIDYNYVDYPQNLSDVQSGIAIQITNQGINNYFDKNIMFSGDWLIQSVIPDITMKISQFNIKFSDIKITDYHLPSTELRYKNGSADLSVKNLSLYLSSQFDIVQSTYPYFQDKGTASLQIIGINIGGVGKLIITDACPLHYFIDISSITTSVNNISVTLDGKLAAIYNSILSTLTNTLIAQFNHDLGPKIVNAILAVGNNALGMDNNFVVNPLYTKEVGLDQRTISYSITPEFLTMHVVGQTLVTDDDTSTNTSSIIRGYDNYSYSTFPAFVTNDHVQYKLHYLAFQSSFDKLIMRDMINQKTDSARINNIHINNYVNTGLHASVEINVSNVAYGVEVVMSVSANPQFYASQTVNQTLIYISEINIIGVYEQGNNIEPNQILLGVLKTQLQNIISSTQKYGIQITNSNGINECQTLMINSDWMHIGCMILI